MQKILEEIQEIEQSYQEITEVVQSPILLSLNEGKYLAPKVRECFEVFYKTALPQIKVGSSSIHVGYSAFNGLGTFFKNADINIDIEVDKNHTKPTYAWQSSFYDQQNQEKYDCLKIDGWLKTDKVHLRSILASAFYHEYQHVYEDYCRQQKCLDNSLYNYVVVSNYGIHDTLAQKYGEVGESIGYILYHLSQVEQRAFIAGGLGEIEQYIKHKFINRFQSPHKIVQETRTYQNIAKLFDKLTPIEQVTDTNLQNSILTDINQQGGVQGMVHGETLQALKDNDVETLEKLNVKKFHFTSWNGFVHFLQERVKKVYTNYINAVSQMINQRNIGTLYSMMHPFS